MTRSLTPSLATAAVLVFALTACPGADTPTGEDSCAGLVDAVDAYAERCAFPPIFRDHDRARYLKVCANMLSAPGASRLDAQLNECAANYASAACGAELECDPTGDLADGSACSEDFQCKSGSCEIPDDEACGVCGPIVPVGGSCANSARCAAGSRCVTTNDSSTCIAITTANEGEACGHEDGKQVECAAGLRCRFGPEGPPTCRALGSVGAGCSSRGDCATGLICADDTCAEPAAEGEPCTLDECGRGLACGGKICKRVAYVEAGASCDLVHGCARGRCKGMEISFDSDEITVKPGTCVDPLPDGAACEDSDECDSFATCIDGTCTLPFGAACK